MRRRRGALAALLCAALCAGAAVAQEGGEEACAWQGGGSTADAAEALRELHASLNAASARIAAERAALDAAAARVAALRASLAAAAPTCGAAPASPATLVAQPPPARDGAGDAVALVPALAADEGAAWAYRLTVAARPAPGWSLRLPLLAALRVLPPAHASALLTLPPEQPGGAPPRFIAVGDSLGRLYVFTSGGALVAQLQAGRSGVTALAAAPLRRNATALATAHADGTLAFHVAEEGPPGADADEAGAPPPALTLATQRAGARVAALHDAAADVAVALLEALPFSGGRLFVAADAAGSLAAFTLDGQGPLAAPASAPRPARALRASAGGGASAARRVLFVSDGGIGTLDLPSPAAAARARAAVAPPLPAALRAVDCAGLNGTRIAAARFDGAASNKVWALSAAGELLLLSTQFAGAAPACSVRLRRALPHSGSGTPQPPFSLALLAPGFVVAASEADVSVYDVAPPQPQPRAPYASSPPPRRPGPRLVLTQRRAALGAPFAAAAAAAAAADALPSAAVGGDDGGEDAAADGDATSSGGPSRGALLAAAPRGSLLLLSLGGGVVGVFENALAPPPATPAAAGRAGAGGAGGWAPRELWSQPLFVVLVALLAWWQFRRAAGDAGAADAAAYRRRPAQRDFAPDFAQYAPPAGAAGRAAVAAAAAGLRGGAPGGDAELQRALRAFNAYAASDAARQ